MICESGKIPYASRAEAMAAANGFRHRKKRDVRYRVRPYECRCGAWHLSKMEEAQFKNRLRRWG
jgi:hypothetical protein